MANQAGILATSLQAPVGPTANFEWAASSRPTSGLSELASHYYLRRLLFWRPDRHRGVPFC